MDINDISSASFSDTEITRLIQISPLPAFVVDPAGSVAAANEAFCALIGYGTDEIIGTKLNRIAKAAEGENIRLYPADPPPRVDVELYRGDGSTLPAEFFFSRLADKASLIFAVDLTDRKRIEQALHEHERKRFQSDRIEALGRLAGGVAHDFNNFLAVLLLHVDILNLNLDADSPIRGRVAEIKEIANSIAGTVRQLFAFGRKQPMTLAPAKLNPAVQLFAEAFRSQAGSVEVELSLDPELGVCFVDQSQIIQVLKNLAVNARDAMPDGGTLRIETENVILDAGTLPVQPAGPYVQIAVSDTGAGIEPSAEDHIFEPFYSSGDPRKSPGLSLAMVYGIVKQSKGFIWVSSRPGKGTTFKIQFPRIDLAQPVNQASAQIANSTGPATVLLVDDEPAVRRITAEFLRISDYEVLPAESGMEALEIAQKHYQPIHLLLTDLSMPLMDGRQLAAKITKLHPETAVLFMSGNIDQESSSDLHEKLHFIGKPFSSVELTEKVRSLLEDQ